MMADSRWSEGCPVLSSFRVPFHGPFNQPPKPIRVGNAVDGVAIDDAEIDLKKLG
jgi:hypothetical protein